MASRAVGGPVRALLLLIAACGLVAMHQLPVAAHARVHHAMSAATMTVEHDAPGGHAAGCDAEDCCPAIAAAETVMPQTTAMTVERAGDPVAGGFPVHARGADPPDLSFLSVWRT